MCVCVCVNKHVSPEVSSLLLMIAQPGCVFALGKSCVCRQSLLFSHPECHLLCCHSLNIQSNG